MGYEEQNIQKIADYLQSGIKEKDQRKIGMEVEHFIIDAKGQKTVSYYGEDGVEGILREIGGGFLDKMYAGDRLVGLVHRDYIITLEPAAQIEVSINPRAAISDLQRIYGDYMDAVTPALERRGYKMINLGYNPLSRVKELALLPKARYVYMEDYFKQTGPCGVNMMRGSASTQVSLDYYSEENCMEVLRTASILGPVFSFMLDNSPIFEGEAYHKAMLRSRIWDYVDPDRTGVVPGIFDEGFGFEAYARYIYQSPAILILEDGEAVYTRDQPACEIYKDRLMDEEEIDHLLSMFFPDVRLRSYLEIRVADSVEGEHSLAYAAFLKGLFYSDSNLELLCDCTKGTTEEDLRSAKRQLADRAYEAEVYGKTAGQWIEMLLEYSGQGLDVEEQAYLEPLKALWVEKKTLAGQYRNPFIKQGD